MKTNNLLNRTVLAALFVLTSMQAAWAGGNNWMASLPDNVYLTQLSIPGAHDAATSGVSSLTAYFAQTQTKTIAEQWESGVRAFDLRPTDESADGPIYHGSGLLRASTGTTLRAELNNLKTKLTANPQEFAIVIIRNENNTGQDDGKWQQVIAPILTDFDDVLMAWNPNLTLGDVRGKILVFARDAVADTKAATVGGIDGWADNTHRATTMLNGDGAFHIILQDYYENVNTTTKNEAIGAMLDESMTIHCPNRLYINHTSGYTGSGLTTDIGACAKATNKYVCDYLDTNAGGPTGIIMMDFAGDDSSNYYGASLVDKIVANNNALTANFNGPAGEYFLQNVETGLWVQGYQAIAGADRARWNTAANVGSYGRPFILQNPGNDGWTLNTQAGDQKLGCEYGDGGLLYLDWAGGGCPTRWKITGTKDNAYITINHDRWLSVDDSNPNLLIKDGTTRNAWKLWTREERLAAMEDATEENPIDVTWLMVNPELMNNDRITPQWTVDRNGGGAGWVDGFRPNRAFETWNYSSLDFYQTISVPNGKYEVQAYALFSPTEGYGLCKADYDDYVANGDATVNGYLYANNQEVKLPSIYSFTSPTPVADYASKPLVDGGLSVIDGWWQAARAMGEDGQYHSQPLRVEVADGTLRLGIKETNNTNPFKSHWIIIGSFSLKYLGELEDFVTPLQNQLADLITEAEAFTGQTTDVLQAALNTALQNANAEKASTDVEVLTARVNALRTAIDNAKAVDVSILAATIALASAEGVTTTAAENVKANGLTAEEVSSALSALRVDRKIAHIEKDEAAYEGNEPAEGEFYLLNVGRKAYLTSGSDWGTHAALGWPGLVATLAQNGNGYTIQFNELISGDARDKYLNGSPYVDGWNNDKDTYTFEPVSGKPGVYAIKGSRGYLAFDPDGEVDGGGIHHFNTVTGTWGTPGNTDAEWMLITKADRLAQMDNASEENPVDVTVIVRDASFNKFAALNNPWTNLDQGWEWGNRNFGDKVTETFNSQTYNLSQEVTFPKAGYYEVSVQSYYRDGNINPHVESVVNGDELHAPAMFYAGDEETPLMYIHAEADKAPGEGTNTAIGNFPNNLMQAAAFFENGLYRNTVRVKVNANNAQLTIGIRKTTSDHRTDNWVVTDNFRVKYLGVDATIDEDIDYSPVATTDAVVKVKRTFANNGSWNSFVVPFDVDEAGVKAAFGDDVVIAEYSEESSDASNVTVNFNKMTTPSLKANTPVVMQTNSEASTFYFVGTIVNSTPKVDGKNFDFVGSYDAEQTIAEGDYFISGTKLYRSAGATTMSGTHAYLKAKTAGARIAMVNFDGGTTTGIEVVESQQDTTDSLYDLQGRSLTKGVRQKGVYIENGKKVIIK